MSKIKNAKGIMFTFLALSLLASVAQCSPPPADPSSRGQRSGLSAEHDNVALLAAIGGSSEYPAWSPNGNLIAFQHTSHRFHQGGMQQVRAIYLVHADGRQVEALTPEEDQNMSCKTPAWAPDGERLVLSCEVNDRVDLYILEMSTRHLSQLTDLSGSETDPAWSPDGAHIAFVRWREADGPVTTTSSIYTISPTGHDLAELTSGPCDTDPGWSPDGLSISFTARKGCASVRSLCVMETVDAALTCNEDARCYDSAWSPDGNSIACIAGSDILNVRVQDRQVVTLLKTSGSIYGLSWSPDGTRLVFAHGSYYGTANDLYVLEARP